MSLRGPMTHIFKGTGIFVTRVDGGSVADRKLRTNDWLLKINEQDVTNKDRKRVIGAVLNERGVINAAVRRRRPASEGLITAVRVNLVGHEDVTSSLSFARTLLHRPATARGGPPAQGGSLIAGDRLTTPVPHGSAGHGLLETMEPPDIEFTHWSCTAAPP
ncbi:hypothetical protein AAFF_G00139650 [Aldrovandia affinis]|uniref:PDZ domain-containing protein n=1 Tax=Aldrovandia affinis TaxID=143900 RepID=A0AAD7X224_9TELE|nr:hypothetical protein AAFF_G00139650 [Aldrovandia affinis]